MSRLVISGLALVALLVAATPAPAGGITSDKLAYLTFSSPVQVPGATLYAGTYRFRLANPDTGRSVIQVLSGDGAIVYSMFHTIPDSRTILTEEPVVTFREVPVGVAQPIDVLFYGGEYRGYAFVYPEGGPNLLPWLAPVVEIEPWVPPRWVPPPSFEPEPPVRRFIDRTPPLEVEQVPAPVTEPPVELPRTASPLPLVFTAALASLAAGLALRRRQ